jgi:tRNA(Ile)-lysidine synthase
MHKKNQPLEEKVLSLIRREGLVIPGQVLVAAVSGGADSVCMLSVLLELQDKLDVRLHVAHLDHCLRGAVSRADARYVAGLARRLGVPVTTESRDVRSYGREHRLSLEEAAREVRYAFLAEVAAAAGAERVAVGHTADDHVETILMHLLRGSGPGGLRGLRPLSRLNCTCREITIVRPLLLLNRDETAAYCRWRRLRPRLDASNLSSKPFRNRVRLELLPELRKYNPRIGEALARLARLAADDLDYIEKEAEQWWQEAVRQEDDYVVLDRQKLAGLPPALQRQVLRKAAAALLGGLKDIEAGHIEDLRDALTKPSGKVVELPGGLRLTVEHDRLLLSQDPDSACPFPALKGEAALNVPGRTCLPGWEVRAEIVEHTGDRENSAPSGLSAWLDFDKAGNKLIARARRPGDRFQPLGLDGTKELTEFMIDARIPRTWRRRIPIVASPDRVVWLVGWRLDDSVKITEATRRVLRLAFTRT